MDNLVQCSKYVLSIYVVLTFLKGYVLPQKIYGITAEDRASIVTAHNDFRRKIAKEYGATNMMKMVWDDELAKSAYKWAQHYEFQHNHFADRYISSYPGTPTGQNMCMNKPDWNYCMNAWFAEQSQFRYGAAYNDINYAAVGHFIQIVYWKSSRIGCGYATCGCYKYFVCEYAVASLYTQDVYKPWSEGSPCADCPGKCDDGLCDCAGKACANMGELIPSTCQCMCSSDSFSGSTCSELNCDVPEYSRCNEMNTTYCRDIPNIYSMCPHHCNRC